MEAREVADALEELFNEIGCMTGERVAEADLPLPYEMLECSARSFYSAGVLTTDAGLVLRLVNGEEYQITVVRSK